MKKTASDLLPALVRKHDLAAVRRLLAEAQPPLTKKDISGALVCALGRDKNSPAIVRLLLENGADPEQSFASMGPVLHCAAMNGAFETVKLLIEFGAEVNRKHGKETALSCALSENETAIAQYLEKLGGKVDPSLDLLYAAKHGNLARARNAVAAGAALDAKGGFPAETPLIAAAGRGHVELVKFLLEQGANPAQRCGEDAPVYAAAGRGKDPRIVEALVGAGASPNIRCYDETPLMAAAEKGNAPMVRALLALGADPKVENKERGMTALDYAKAAKNKEIVALLAGLGVNAERDGKRALAHRLRREFKARLTEHSTGFLLNAKFAGRTAQFRVDADDAAVAVFGVKFTLAEFRGQRLPSLTIGHGKPAIPGDDARLRRASAASKAAGLDVHASVGLDDDGEARLVAFCERLRPRFHELVLEPGDFLHFSHNFAAFVWRATDPDRAVARLQRFAALLEMLARPPEPERRLFDREWLIKPAPAAGRGVPRAVRHVFGSAGETPVACPGCAAAANPIIRIDLGDSQLPSGALGKSPLSVHWCLDCGEWSPVFFPLAEPAAKAPRALEPNEDNLPEREMMLEPVPAGKKAGRKSKLGGSPSWLQMEDTPDCRTCAEPMTFALQMQSDARISYGDLGLLYVFVCPTCRVLATLVQSH